MIYSTLYKLYQLANALHINDILTHRLERSSETEIGMASRRAIYQMISVTSIFVSIDSFETCAAFELILNKNIIFDSCYAYMTQQVSTHTKLYYNRWMSQ